MEIETFEVGVISPLLDVCCYEFLDKPTVIGALCCYEFLDKPTARCMFEVDLSEFYPVSFISCFFYFKCVSTDFFQASDFRPPLTFPPWLVVIISQVQDQHSKLTEQLSALHQARDSSYTVSTLTVGAPR